jgi:hypothetical protein
MAWQEINRTIYSILFFLAWWLLPSAAFASGASLYLSPSTVSCAPGVTFVVDVYATSQETAVNAIEGNISFPSDKLSIVSLDKDDSSINFWVQEPASGSGSVSFKGIILNPGFIGSGGKLVSIHLKANNVGEGVIQFASASVLANDGKGTKIPVSLGSTRISISASGNEAPSSSVSLAPVIPVPAKLKSALVGEVPSAPVIASVTHPDSQAWYADRNVRLSWELPDGVTDVSFILDDKPDTVPGNVSDGSFAATEFADMESGTRYFHLKFKNTAGWGESAHFQINIDNQEPESASFEIMEGEDIFGEGLRISFGATDILSGISRFGLVVDDSEEIVLSADQSEVYMLPPVASGAHIAVLRAYDRADNQEVISKEFQAGPFDLPSVETYVAEGVDGKFLIVRGRTYPQASVAIWLKKGEKDFFSYHVSSDQSGEFFYMSEEEIESGSYVIQVEATGKAGFQTAKTAEKIFQVRGEAHSFASPLDYAIAAILIVLLMAILIQSQPSTKAREEKKNPARRRSPIRRSRRYPKP